MLEAMKPPEPTGDPAPPATAPPGWSTPSASAAQARAAELRRILKLSPIERMALALRLGRRRRRLRELQQRHTSADHGR